MQIPTLSVQIFLFASHHRIISIRDLEKRLCCRSYCREARDPPRFITKYRRRRILLMLGIYNRKSCCFYRNARSFALFLKKFRQLKSPTAEGISKLNWFLHNKCKVPLNIINNRDSRNWQTITIERFIIAPPPRSPGPPAWRRMIRGNHRDRIELKNYCTRVSHAIMDWNDEASPSSLRPFFVFCCKIWIIYFAFRQSPRQTKRWLRRWIARFLTQLSEGAQLKPKNEEDEGDLERTPWPWLN